MRQRPSKRQQINRRARGVGTHVISTLHTIRQTAADLGLTRSTVYRDLTVILPSVDSRLARQVAKVLAMNKYEASLRGGLMNRLAWQERRAKKLGLTG